MCRKDETSLAGLVLNPSILVFTKKGRGRDAYSYSKSLDAKGRFKFQFQSFVHFGLAYRTVVTLWTNRMLSLEQRMEIVANVEAGDTDYVAGKERSDNTESFLGFEEANMSEVYSTNLPFTAESLIFPYDKESIEEEIMDKMGCMNYTATPWEKVNDNPRLEQRQQFYKLNHCLCQFGSRVMCIQQRIISDDAKECFLSENCTLLDVPFGDHFQVHVRREVQNISVDPPISSCKVFLGVAWQKSTLFQERITKNCMQNFTKLLKEKIELTVRELLAYKNNSLC